MKLGVTGTQYGASSIQKADAWRLIDSIDSLAEFHHGNCIGVDTELANLVSRLHPNCIIHSHPPLEKARQGDFVSDVVHKPADFLYRNHRIVDAVQLLLALPKEPQEVMRSGTWATVRYARKTNVPRLILRRR
jgi:hypothetical protein